MHQFCDPRHQGVVLNAIEKRVKIKIDAPHRDISDGLACPLDSVMRRAPRAKPEAMGMELGSKTGVSTCETACQINRSTTAGTPSIPDRQRAWGSSPSGQAPADRCPRRR